MRTILLDEPGAFRMTETDPPGDPRPGQALLRVRRVGICGSDLHAFRGQHPFYVYPCIIGHELGIEVEQIGENDRGIEPGDRCTLNPYVTCGRCVACRQGRSNCCETLSVIGIHEDGGMRERFIVPAEQLHRSDTLSFGELALVEMMGIGCHAVQRSAAGPGDTVLVTGVGPIGLTVVQFALLAGARVLVMDLAKSRLKFVEEHFDVAACIHAGDDAAAQIRQLTDSDMPHIVFDATGSIASMQNAFSLVSHGGKLVLVGLIKGDITFNDPEFHRRETTLFASRNALPSDFDRIIDHLERGEIDANTWITHPVGMDEMIDAFEGWLDPQAGVIKAMVEI